MNRWKVACINWSHDSAPKAVAYRIGKEGWVNWQKYFRTHAEAIAYAQEHARLTCTNCGRRMPYLEACIDGQPYCHPEQGQDCYVETSRALALEHSGYSIPQKFMIGTEKP